MVNRIKTANIRLCVFLFLGFIRIQCFGQIDSLSLNNTNSNIVFYSLARGIVSDIPNDDWHFAFSSKPAIFPSNTLQSTTIRINEANGVKVFRVPNIRVADFDFVDTTGWKTWEQLHDSDTLMWMGAFNRNKDLADIYNYGWGSYNFGVHSVVGNDVYLVELPNNEFKKLAILKNEWDTAFVIKYAGIDNSLPTQLTIPKRPYKTKNFAYLNILNNAILDREPLATDWDFSYAIYNDASGTKRIGLLLNNGISLHNSVHNTPNLCQQTTDFDSRMNAFYQTVKNKDTLISLNSTVPVNAIKSNGHIYLFKTYLNLTSRPLSFDESSTFYFSKSICNNATGIASTADKTWSVFPNPASSVLTIESITTELKSVSIFDLQGKVIFTNKDSLIRSTIDVSSFINGIYFVEIIAEGKRIREKLIIAK